MSNGFLDRISNLKERESIFSLWNFGLQNHKKEILFQSILQITFRKSESPQINLKEVVTLHLTQYLRFGVSLNWNSLITDSSPSCLIGGLPFTCSIIRDAILCFTSWPFGLCLSSVFAIWFVYSLYLLGLITWKRYMLFYL